MMNSVVGHNSEPFHLSQKLTYTYSRTEEVSISAQNSAVNDTMVTLTGASVESESLTYSRSMTLEGRVGAKYDLLRSLVVSLLTEQGASVQLDTGQGGEIDIRTLTPGEAQELVADDGYFGVEQTADRIVQQAMGLTGGDPSRIEAIREGVKKGFQEAKDALGGWLPEISYQTYDRVMEKLDQWA